MSSCIIIGGILLASDKLFRMEKLSVCSCSNLINDSRFQIDENCPGNMFPGPSFTEESIKTVVPTTDSFVRWHLPVRLDPMFEAIQLPARVSDLNSGLTDMNGNAFPLK